MPIHRRFEDRRAVSTANQDEINQAHKKGRRERKEKRKVRWIDRQVEGFSLWSVRLLSIGEPRTVRLSPVRILVLWSRIHQLR